VSSWVYIYKLMNHEPPSWQGSPGIIVNGPLRHARKLARKLHARFIVSQKGRVRRVEP
jgi:hypothetical protein